MVGSRSSNIVPYALLFGSRCAARACRGPGNAPGSGTPAAEVAPSALSCADVIRVSGRAALASAPQAMIGCAARMTASSPTMSCDPFFLYNRKVLTPTCRPATRPVIDPAVPSGRSAPVTSRPFNVSPAR